MQFGKFHGMVLVALGLVLLGMQVIFYLTPQTMTSGALHAAMPKAEHRTNPAAGIFGAVLLIAGTVIFVTGRRADEPDVQHAVR